MTRPRVDSLRMDFYPAPPQIPLLRRFVIDFYTKLAIDAELVSRLALTTHEMLENAMKYSLDGMARLEIDVEHDGTPSFTVRTINKSTASNIEHLTRQFAEMSDYTDSWQFYRLTMERTAWRLDGSGLGLARLWAEADMTLSLRLDGEIVEIRANSKPR